jgi:beta-phosphoglucomutase-like phosphatase (HAD superfamily)
MTQETFTPSSLPRAVLWDLDGTLVDSEPLWMDAESRLMVEHKLPWSHDDAMLMVGNALPDSAEIMRSRGLRLPVRHIIDRLLDDVVARMATEISWRPGAKALLTALQEAGVPQALVTMSEMPMADAVVANLGFDPFSVRVTGERVEKGKPDPEPYLMALALLDAEHSSTEGPVTAANSVAIEDSVPGSSASLGAGLKTVGVPLHVPLAPREGMVLVRDLTEVTPQFLGGLLAAPVATEVSS